MNQNTTKTQTSSKTNVAHRTQAQRAAMATAGPVISDETNVAMRKAFFAQFGRDGASTLADVPADLRAALAVTKGHDRPPFELLAAAVLLFDVAADANAFADELANSDPAEMVASIRAALRVVAESAAELENTLAARVALEKRLAAQQVAKWEGVE